MLSNRLKALFGMLSIVTLLSGCGIFKHEPTITPLISYTTYTTPASADAYKRGKCFFEIPEDMPENMRADIQCATLTVPEDRLKMDSQEIQLAVAIVKTGNAKPKPDPVLVIIGNAGFGVNLAYALPSIFPDIAADRDMIVVDQRGTGFSTPSFECPELTSAYAELNKNTTLKERNDQTIEASTTCAKNLNAAGVNLPAYTTSAMAADMEDLRQVLAINQWNIYTLFNGSRLALTMMRDYPQGIRSVIMDTPIPLQANPEVEYGTNVAYTLDRFFKDCDADELCYKAYPKVKDTFYKLLDQLDAQPVIIDVADLNSGNRYKVTLDSERLITFLLGILYSPDRTGVGEIPRMIYQLQDGKTEAASRLLGGYDTGFGFQRTAMDQWLNCNEELSFMTQEQVVKANEEIGLHLGKYFNTEAEGSLLACEPWKAPGAQIVENMPVESSIPSLLMAGEYDWIQPPSWADWAGKTLHTSTVVKFNGAGIVAALSPQWSDCSRQIINAFLETPSARPDITCASKPYKYTWITLP